jgi:hypothetical protein
VSDDIRVWLKDRECRLLPISAEGYIDAKSRANENSASSTDDEIARLIFGAYLLAEGAYYDDEPAFTSGEEVLKALTAQEIMGAAEEYLLPEVKSVDSEDGIPDNENRSGTGEAAQVGAYDRNASVSDSSAMGENNRKSLTDAEAFTIGQERTETVDETSGNTKTSWETMTAKIARRKAEGTNAVSTQEGRASRAAFGGYTTTIVDMREISDFFERDSRRYGGGFTRY